MSTICVDQDHQIVSKTRILDPCVLAVARGLLCSLKHTVHLIEVDITEQWRDDAPNAKDNFGSLRGLSPPRSAALLAAPATLRHGSSVPRPAKTPESRHANAIALDWKHAAFAYDPHRTRHRFLIDEEFRGLA